MGLRFRRSFRIMPGVRINLGKRGASLSIGGHGVTTTIGPNGVYNTYSIPGTGLSYRQRLDGGGQAGTAAPAPTQASQVQSGVYSAQLQPDGSVDYIGPDGQRATDAAAREVRRQGRATLIPWLEQTAREFNAQVQPLLTLHHATPAPMDAAHYVPPAFPTPAPVPPLFVEVPPVPEPELEDANWLEERIPLLENRLEERNAELMADYQRRVRERDAEDLRAQEKYVSEELRWEAEMEAWETALAAFDADQMHLQRMLTAPEAGDEPYLADYLRQRIAAVAWPRAVTTTVSVTDLGRTVTVDAALPHYDAAGAPWPSTVASVNSERVRIYYKDKLKRDIKAEYTGHIYAVAFRLIGEVYGAYPGAAVVLLEVRSTAAPGQSEKRELRLRVDRGQWAGTDFRSLPALDIASHLSPWRW